MTMAALRLMPRLENTRTGFFLSWQESEMVNTTDEIMSYQSRKMDQTESLKSTVTKGILKTDTYNIFLSIWFFLWVYLWTTHNVCVSEFIAFDTDSFEGMSLLATVTKVNGNVGKT